MRMTREKRYKKEGEERERERERVQRKDLKPHDSIETIGFPLSPAFDRDGC